MIAGLHCNCRLFMEQTGVCRSDSLQDSPQHVHYLFSVRKCSAREVLANEHGFARY